VHARISRARAVKDRKTRYASREAAFKATRKK
jgi:hypothetical protein